MKLHNLLFQLFCLVRGQFKFTDIIRAVQIGIVVSQLGLDRVGTQQSQSRKGTGQPPRNDVLSKLKTQVVPEKKAKYYFQRAQRNLNLRIKQNLFFYATDERSVMLVSNFYLYFYLGGNIPTVNSMETGGFKVTSTLERE